MFNSCSRYCGSDISRIDLVIKNLLVNCFRSCRKRNDKAELCEIIIYKCRKNRNNNKCNRKIQDLENEEAKKGPEKSANVAKIENQSNKDFCC